MKKANAVIRVSTAKQDSDNQKFAITRAHPDTEFTWFVEDDVSGGLPWEKRPVLLDAIRSSRKNKIPLVVYSLSRLGRTSEIATFWEQNVANKKIQVSVVDMPQLDDKMVGGIAWINSMERKVISERTKVAMSRIKEEIALNGSYKTKEGKVITSLGGTSNKKASVVGNAQIQANADKFAANVLPLIQSLKDQGLSLKAIAEELNERQIKTRRDTEWYASSVSNILRRAA